MKLLLTISLVVAACLLTHRALNPRPSSAWAAVLLDDGRSLAQWLDNGTSVNERNPEGQSLLIFAVVNQSCPATRLLLERGADPNARDALGHTPVYYATCIANMPLVRLLVDNGADTTSCDPDVIANLQQCGCLPPGEFPWHSRTNVPKVGGRPEPGSEMGRL